MPRMSTGYIIAGAYADKVRRVLFAQAKSLGIPSEEVVEASRDLNVKLLKVLQECGIDKGDVVRIMIEFEVENGKIRWLWDTLVIEAFKRVDLGDKPKRVLNEIISSEQS